MTPASGFEMRSASARGYGAAFRDRRRRRRHGAGVGGINAITWVHRVGQLGYWVAPEARQRGVATRSVRLLSRWALGSLRLARVEIRVDVENAASQQVAEAGGFTREGVLRSRAESRGRRWDEVMYSLLPPDLEAAEK